MGLEIKSGETGIRTQEAVRPTRFPGVLLKPTRTPLRKNQSKLLKLSMASCSVSYNSNTLSSRVNLKMVRESSFNPLSFNVPPASRTSFKKKRTVAITRVFPTATGGPFIMQLGIQNFAGGPVTWGGEHTFDPGTDRYFDIRMTGELLCYRIKSINDIRFSFSGARIQILPAGLR